MNNTDGNLAALEQHQNQLDEQAAHDDYIEKISIDLEKQMIENGFMKLGQHSTPFAETLEHQNMAFNDAMFIIFSFIFLQILSSIVSLQ